MTARPFLSQVLTWMLIVLVLGSLAYLARAFYLEVCGWVVWIQIVNDPSLFYFLLLDPVGQRRVEAKTFQDEKLVG